MPRVIRLYVHYVDAASTVIGKATMYLTLVMMVILLASAIGRALGLSLIWAVESAQFTMTAFYLVGGAYSMLLRGHVRMDLVYGRFSSKGQGRTDIVTSVLLVFYLVVLLIGAISSIDYALRYDQTSRSVWGPPLAPIKIIMASGISLMLLQAISTFFKDLAAARGRTIDGELLHE